MLILIVDDSTRIQLLEEHHAQELFNLTDENREHLKQWLPWLDNNKTIGDSRNFIRNSLQNYTNCKGIVAGIWFEKELVGVIGLNEVDWIGHKTTIGYWLGAAFQGKGLMTRSCRAIIDYAFDKLGMERVEIHCATENVKSRAIPERLGFKEMGIVQYAEWLYDHFVDHVIYGMHIRDWQNLQQIEKEKI